MITFPRIKAAGWAIGKRLQGYHLLKNPAGTPQTEVNMVKELFYGNSANWDDVFHIMRIKKVYTNNSSDEESKFLMSMHFFDDKTMQMTKPRKKDITISIRKNGLYDNLKERTDLAWEQIDRRIVPKLSHKRSGFFGPISQYDKMCKTKLEAQVNRGYYKKHYSLGTKILSLGLYKSLCYPQENRPNFFKVLYQNLTNKV